MQQRQTDFTFKAIFIGLILSLVMVAANMYLGLKGGMTISANIPCSVIAVILFNTMFRNRNIAEINVAQATGSVGEGLAAGVVFIFPALVFASVYKKFDTWGWTEYLTITGAILGGSLLGIILTGFLRRPMVVEAKELRFPEGVATAEILKTGMAAFSSGGKKESFWGVGLAILVGVFSKVFSSGIAILQESSSFIFRIKNSIFGFGTDLSAAMVGVGFIIEYEGAVMVAMGGALSWLIFIPIYTANFPLTGDALEIAEDIWRSQVRYIGVGGMIVGGIWSIFQIRKQLVDSIVSVFQGLSGKRLQSSENERDLSQKQIWTTICLGLIISAIVYFCSVPLVGAIVALVYTMIALFLFVAISVYIVGLIGSTNQPVSGITICTFLLAAIFLLAAGQKGDEGVLNILLVAGVVCLAVCLSGTAAQNFKTASIVGGTPRAMQLGLLISVFVTSLVAAPLLQFLDKAYVIGSEKLSAPQANMFANMAKGIFDPNYQLPWDMVGLGIVIGIFLVIVGVRMGLSAMAISVGIYLPFTTTIPILFGGIIHKIVRMQNKDNVKFNAAVQRGTVFCSGLVAGEAITAILLAAFIFADYGLPLPLIEHETVRIMLSLYVAVMIPIILYKYIKASGK